MMRRFDPTSSMVVVLVLLQVLSVVLVWTLDPVAQQAQAMFALYVAIMLVSFSMISYTFRVQKKGDSVNRGLLLGGAAFILLLLWAALFV